jgi:hypothetical protein
MEWIRPFMSEILEMERRREILKVLLFVTKPRSNAELRSPSATVRMFPGKPNIPALIKSEMETQIGAMAVSVCGKGSLSDEIRSVVRSQQKVKNIDFYENSFSW